MSSKWWLVLAASGALALGVAACGDSGGGGGASGTINIDGSSTVFPFAQAAAEQFKSDNPDVKITVGESGTGGGFEKFCAGETDISDASRPIEPEEIAACKKNGVAYDELQVATDGIAVVTNPAIDVKCLTTDQLKQLWNKGSTVKNLSELGKDAETGQPLPTRSSASTARAPTPARSTTSPRRSTAKRASAATDYQPSEDDNVLVQGVSGDQGGLGYFGFSYYEQNQDKLNLVAVDGGDGCVAPSTETIQDGDVQAALAPAVHVPERRRRCPATRRSSAVPRVHRGQLPVDRRGGADRADAGRHRPPRASRSSTRSPAGPAVGTDHSVTHGSRQHSAGIDAEASGPRRRAVAARARRRFAALLVRWRRRSRS